MESKANTQGLKLAEPEDAIEVSKPPSDDAWEMQVEEFNLR
jgi:hypothetical protein